LKDYCVYTSIFGKYEELNEQPVAEGSDIDFFCFTDDHNLTSKTWKIIQVEPILPTDFVRSSRVVKICPHRYLHDYDTSLYIDNRVRLKQSPDMIFRDLFPEQIDIALVEHSYRSSVLDEFNEILKGSYDDPGVVQQQLFEIQKFNPVVLSQKPFWSGFIIRNHNQPDVISVMEDWLAHVLYFSRRDQLSINFVLSRTPLKLQKIALDNLESPYHSWPKGIRYGSPKGDFTHGNDKYPNIESEADRNIQIEILQKQLYELSKEARQYEMSNSWRYTRPIREFVKILKKDKQK
jgi:hypothetical protein